MMSKDQKLILLNVIFASALVVANVIAGKLVMFSENFIVPAAVVVYAVTFLITDIIHENYGKKQAKQTIIFGFIAQIFASIMILFGQLLPVAPFAQESQTAYETLLGQNARFVLASLAAYLTSQHIDVWIFSMLKKLTHTRLKWLRNNLSTAISQLIDTTVFITIAFIGNVPNIWMMILSQYVIKLGIATLDTPIFYWLTRKNKQTDSVNQPMEATS
ncbi:VUT family protein [Filobacillus milosensis]|uniref:Probable queuosine precursor transporter n=1 Tax=Filobacillus milosensis TaxID=94137 RepID=A0A4Y8IR29_9BACI|nr:queuosine precursor transporter [Filobacillus milosensis]TFB23291.1 VUT family protein [Filobacillus milosensis]